MHTAILVIRFMHDITKLLETIRSCNEITKYWTQGSDFAYDLLLLN